MLARARSSCARREHVCLPAEAEVYDLLPDIVGSQGGEAAARVKGLEGTLEGPQDVLVGGTYLMIVYLLFHVRHCEPGREGEDEI